MRLHQSYSDELLAFRQFRQNVIGFLKLPIDVSESALRDALNAVSPTLLSGYKHRAVQAALAWASMCRSDMQSMPSRVPADENAAVGARPGASNSAKPAATAS